MQQLKTTSRFFQAVFDGYKTAEIRFAGDREFSVDEVLELAEIDDYKKLTGRFVVIKITHILTCSDLPQGLMPDYVMLSFRLLRKDQPCDVPFYRGIFKTRQVVPY